MTPHGCLGRCHTEVTLPSRRGHSISSLYKPPTPTPSSLFPTKDLLSLRKWKLVRMKFLILLSSIYQLTCLHLQLFLCYLVLQMGEQSALSPKATLGPWVMWLFTYPRTLFLELSCHSPISLI